MKKILLGLLLFINICAAGFLIGAYLATHFSPNSLPYVYFLGLAYPYILYANLIFVVIWLFLKRKYALISGLTILIGFNHLLNFYAFTSGGNDLEKSVKFCSYNVKIFNLYDTENRIKTRDECFSFLEEIGADVYCFQEFYNQEQPSDFETKSILLEKLGFDNVHEGYTHKLRGDRYFGLATISKYPIVDKGEIFFDNDANNFCIYSDILVEAETLRVYNAHLGSIRFQNDDYQVFGDELHENAYIKKEAGQQILSRLKQAFEKRAVQAEEVATHIAESPHSVVLCMDLNDTPISYAYQQFTAELNDAFLNSGWGTGKTYIGKMPSNRIDYIFYSDDLESNNFTTEQVEFSDHKPITCEIGLP
ncbi:MAG: endonuclease/exonuclease/phosphatase family protein [Crocinitomicaceae bacterium]|nr:endonuclease/exonuclease/phosphatase family protein [Crocinitomicaceae bacterium]